VGIVGKIIEDDFFILGFSNGVEADTVYKDEDIRKDCLFCGGQR
jgi:hypothetical protein